MAIIKMTLEQKEKFRELANECVRDDKKEELYKILSEIEEIHDRGELTKKHLNSLGFRFMGIVKVLKMVSFARRAKALSKEYDIQVDESTEEKP